MFALIDKQQMKEIEISREYLFEGRILKMRLDTVSTPEGNTATREIVEHPGGVGVIALDDEGCVYMVWQYRRPFDDVLYEVPAGKRDFNEEPILCAKRELEEETGLSAKTWTYMGVSYASPGFCDEGLHLFLATDLCQGEVHRDPDEVMLVERVPLTELVERVMNGEIKDGKTIIGILKVNEYLKRNGK